MVVKTAASVLEKFSTRRENLIPMLQKVQEVEGFISPESIKLISDKLRISENEIYGVSTFYAQFRFTPPGEHSIYVCMGTACHVKGGQQILNMLEYELGIKEGQTTEDGRFDLNRVACLGCCALAPVIKIDDKIYSQMSVLKLMDVLEKYTQSVEVTDE
ncbi:NADH-quinone oxidoreductase subunit NuoE [bacterium]|nr:NADH-quinone oxidoreductase subunit NuoE [bacterium]